MGRLIVRGAVMVGEVSEIDGKWIVIDDMVAFRDSDECDFWTCPYIDRTLRLGEVIPTDELMTAIALAGQSNHFEELRKHSSDLSKTLDLAKSYGATQDTMKKVVTGLILPSKSPER